jgi:hypothetical protein
MTLAVEFQVVLANTEEPREGDPRVSADGMVHVCAWCHPGFKAPGRSVTHGICRKHLAEAVTDAARLAGRGAA